MTSTRTIHAPWAPDDIQRLNERQWDIGHDPGAPPIVCINAHDGLHNPWGGILGLMVATQDGWVCTDCAYTLTEATIHETAAEADTEALRDRTRSILTELRALRALGKKGSDVLINCMEARLRQLSAFPVNSEGTTAVWTIYDHPWSYPNHFAARKWVMPAGAMRLEPTGDILLDEDLDALRNKLPPGLTRLNRQLGEDPVVIESWY